MKFSQKYIISSESGHDRYQPLYAWAEYATPDNVFSYLKEESGKPYRKNSWLAFGDDESWLLYDSVEQLLLSRNEPLINIGLALYGNCCDVCSFIYQNGDSRLREYVLGGNSIGENYFKYDYGWIYIELKKAIKNLDIEFIIIILANNSICDSVRNEFLLHTNIFSSIPEKEWFVLFYWLSLPRYSQKFLYLDDNDVEFDTIRMYESFWNLLDSINIGDLNDVTLSRAIGGLSGFSLTIT
jgi:hypothetical protein